MRLSKAIAQGAATSTVHHGRFEIFCKRAGGDYAACAKGFALIGAVGLDEVLRTWDLEGAPGVQALFDYTFPNVSLAVERHIHYLNDDGLCPVKTIAERIGQLGF